MTTEGRTHTEERFTSRQAVICSKDYFSKCTFSNAILTTQNKAIKDVIFKSCNFFNTTIVEFTAWKDRFIDCTFYNTRLEDVTLTYMLFNNNAFSNCTFINLGIYDSNMYNTIISETKSLIRFRMNNCSVVGGCIPPSVRNKIDIINTTFKSAEDVFQDADALVTSPVIIPPIPQEKIVVQSTNKKPYLFISEGV